MKTKKRKITLEILAQMVGEGFNQMDERFDVLEKRVDSIDIRTITLENGHKQILRKLDIYTPYWQHEELKARVDKLERKILTKKK